MTFARGLTALLAVLGGLTEARAQFAIGGPGVAFGVRQRNVAIGVSLGGGFGYSGYGYSGYGYSGLGYGYGYGYGNPYWGPRYGTSVYVYAPQQPIYVPQPIIVQQPVYVPQPIVVPVVQRSEPNLVDPIVIGPRNQRRDMANQRRDPDDDDRPLPGVAAGGFRPVRPEDRARAMQPAAPAPGAAPRAMPPERRKADPPDEGPADPLAQGKKAFVDREYGRAVRFFKQATEARPDAPLAYFLLAQAQFAFGKYAEAVASVHDGLRLDRDWPTSRFRPAALYAGNVADYNNQMDALREALKAQPNDPVLLFLCGYQLWFDGQEDDAKRLFGRARKLVTQPRFIDLFLLGPPGGPMVAR